MAQFEVTFYEYVRPMDYDDYVNNQSAICNDDAQSRDIEFNTNGDFSLGFNYSGDTPATITITGFTDTMEEFETAGPIGVPSGFVPSTLRDITNTDITYPYTCDVTDLVDLYINPNSAEMLCNGSDKFYTERTRIITYYITDINSNIGPTRTSTLFQTTQ